MLRHSTRSRRGACSPLISRDKPSCFSGMTGLFTALAVLVPMPVPRLRKAYSAAIASSVPGTRPRFLRGQARFWSLQQWTRSRAIRRGSRMDVYS